MKTLEENELIEIIGGGELWDRWTKKVQDAGQWVGGFVYGLFTGDCPSEC